METQKPAEALLGEQGFVVFKAITRCLAIITSIATIGSSFFIILWLVVLSAMNWSSRYSPPVPQTYYIYVCAAAIIGIAISGRFMYHDDKFLGILKQREKWLFIFFNLVFMYTLYAVETTLHLYETITFLPK